jgi:hypothetical protein
LACKSTEIVCDTVEFGLTSRASLMDPLSLTASLVAVINVAYGVLAFCWNVQAELRNAPWALRRLIKEVRELRDLAEGLQFALDEKGPDESVLDERGDEGSTLGKHDARLHWHHALGRVLGSCLAELQAVEKMLKPGSPDGTGSKRQAFVRALSWMVNQTEINEAVDRLERSKSSLQLSIAGSNMYVRGFCKPCHSAAAEMVFLS